LPRADHTEVYGWGCAPAKNQDTRAKRASALCEGRREPQPSARRRAAGAESICPRGQGGGPSLIIEVVGADHGIFWLPFTSKTYPHLLRCWGECRDVLLLRGSLGAARHALRCSSRSPAQAGASTSLGVTAPNAKTRMHGSAKPMRELQNLLPRADRTGAYALSGVKGFRRHPVRRPGGAPKQH
jgi:hypothetical protein